MDDLQKFYDKALRFLAYRPRSEKEVRDHLNIKDQISKIKNAIKDDQSLTSLIDKVIQKLKEQKFLNDEEFARWWIEQRTQFKPRSLRLIKVELRQKGIADELIESGIGNQESFDSTQDKSGIRDDLQRAKKLIEKRIERVRNLSKQEIYRKLGSYLSRRGFDWDTIKQSIDESLSKGV